ncbi:amino acid ABC transporter substrate-binding protein/permease [Carnobacterium gallinarum]|uniref:amino acid ABC transporter substrate-binding protein/permease n=1 Tax=Carnobacterium gallinarum TaxID=2749 RepID=UPI0005549655|nr:amino acid ABC transporter substrate-binding protein/permease [Carnobacterium gallinarum]
MNKKKHYLFLFSLLVTLGILLTGFSTTEAHAETKEKYIIGTDVTFAPFEFQDANNNFVGIDMDLLKAIAKDQGFEVEIKPLGFNAAVQALQANQVDGVIAGMSITNERKQSFDFSTPYFESGVVMAVSESNNDIKSYKDLKGKTVAIKTGTEGATFANSIKDKYGFNIATFDDSANMYEAVKAGSADAAFEDYPVMAYAITQNAPLKLVGEKEKGGQYGFAVNKGKNQELLTKFNNGLTNLKNDGTYQKITEKYLGEEKTEKQSIFALVKENYKQLLSGLGTTLFVTLISIAIASVLGIVFGLMSVTPSKTLRIISMIYVDIMRGIPMMVLAFFVFFTIPQLLGIKMIATVAAIIVLSLNAGAYIAELVRGGINAVDKGQLEAARSLGLPYSKAMGKIILPQAIKIMIPSFINQFVITLKDTTILSVIGLVELTQSGKIVVARTYDSNMWFVIAIIYIVVITALTKVSNLLERRATNG